MCIFNNAMTITRRTRKPCRQTSFRPMPCSAANPTHAIRQKALTLGFVSIGFAPILTQRQALGRLCGMTGEGRHGEMRYLETGQQKRADPCQLLPGAKTLISAALGYNLPEYTVPGPGMARISRHAVIEDYHRVLKRQLEQLLDFIRSLYEGKLQAIIAVDSFPVLEKVWAETARLGRTGKNTLLITPSSGSYVFLGEMLIDREIRESPPSLQGSCGACRICLESCPTGALLEAGKLDARRCISYLTIELKREFTEEESAMVGNWLFGCDICQEVCPANRSRKPAMKGLFSLKQELLKLTPDDILNLTGSGFRKLFYGTPIYRLGLKRLKRNARAVKQNLSPAQKTS